MGFANSWFLYILSCSDGTLYTGITKDVVKRLKQHSNGTGARYTRGRAPLKLECTVRFLSKSAALREEIRVKKFTRAKKIKYIHANLSI